MFATAKLPNSSCQICLLSEVTVFSTYFLLLERYVPNVAKNEISVSMYILTTDRLTSDRPTTSHLEKIEWPYLRNRSSDPLHVWFQGGVFGDGGSNGAIYGSNKFKMAAAAILEKFQMAISPQSRIVWPSERTSSPIHISEQRVAVHQQMHTQNHTAYHIQFGEWFSRPVPPIFSKQILILILWSHE